MFRNIAIFNWHLLPGLPRKMLLQKSVLQLFDYLHFVNLSCMCHKIFSSVSTTPSFPTVPYLPYIYYNKTKLYDVSYGKKSVCNDLHKIDQICGLTYELTWIISALIPLSRLLDCNATIILADKQQRPLQWLCQRCSI